MPRHGVRADLGEERCCFWVQSVGSQLPLSQTGLSLQGEHVLLLCLFSSVSGEAPNLPGGGRDRQAAGSALAGSWLGLRRERLYGVAT